ncbi:MAG TPA: hypothetical protein VKP30_14055 [Polyangiaceae bacterium]|nr:hypothetical protein [Polyangiaceae bacterium]
MKPLDYLGGLRLRVRPRWAAEASGQRLEFYPDLSSVVAAIGDS